MSWLPVVLAIGLLTGSFVQVAGLPLLVPAAQPATDTLWMWGSNNGGQLGDGTTNTRYRPQVVPGLRAVLSVSAGSGHTVAALADSSLWTWGDRGRQVPTPTLGVPSPRQVAAGDSDLTLALAADGTVWAGARTLTASSAMGRLSCTWSPGVWRSQASWPSTLVSGTAWP
jgi:regulator of chromosome condensation (RCC1) repeat-containing protein